jgi:hypothetical protein
MRSGRSPTCGKGATRSSAGGRASLRRTWCTPYEVLAAEGETGIAHRNVKARSEGEPHRVEWDGILLITFAPDGRCRDHREWLVRRELPAG